MAMSDRFLDASAGAHARATVQARVAVHVTTFSVILSLSFCHLLNDMMQSLVPALYPILKGSYGLSFSQVGLITLAFQCTASMLQPLVGLYTDRRPQPYSLTVGIGITMVGLLLMSRASSYPSILLAAMLIGMGSSIFHPEASRVARMAAGGRTASRNRCFRWAVILAPLRVRCSPPSWWCRMDSRASRGSRAWRWSPSSC